MRSWAHEVRVRPGTAWLVAFVVIGAVECVAELVHAMDLAFVLKATLMPLLGLWAGARVRERGSVVHRRILGALAGSWVGDVALMLAPASPSDTSVLGLPKHPLWFLVGVAGFFVAHLLFISLFRRVDRPHVEGPWPKRWAWFVPLVIWAALAGALVFPGVLGDPTKRVAALPLAAYALLLHAMVGFAIQRHGRVGRTSFLLVTTGAATFLLSDTLIGLNFLVPGGASASAGFWIMVTYLLAEALIVAGLVAQEDGR